MNNGDDIHNLLKTLGHDAGLYQDLAQYNASRAAVRRAAMARPAEPAATPPVAAPAPTPPTAAPALPPSSADVPRVLRIGAQASLSSILHRLATPHGPAASAGQDPQGPATHAPRAAPPPQPIRLDHLFGRLATRTSHPLGR